MPLRQDFGSFRQPVSPTRELAGILGDLQGQVTQEQKMQMAEQVQKDALAQQAVENQRQGELLRLRKAEDTRAQETLGDTQAKQARGDFTADQISKIIAEPDISKRQLLLKNIQDTAGGFTPSVQESVLLSELTTKPVVEQKPVTGSVTITSPDGKRTTNVPYQTLDTWTKQGWLVGKDDKDGSGASSSSGKPSLISEDPKHIGTLRGMATTFYKGRSFEEGDIAQLSNDADILQQLTDTKPDALIERLPDVLTTSGIFGTGTGFIDKDKVNQIFKNRNIELGDKSIPVGQAMELLRQVDTEGDRKYVISKDKKGKVSMELNSLYDEAKKVDQKTQEEAGAAATTRRVLTSPLGPLGTAASTGYDLYNTLRK